ncbi:hypothetical protein ACFLYE_00380 [Chloroflexota bacterium]
MDTEERIKALEDEFRETKDELCQILLDIRAYIMEAQNPLKLFERGKKPRQTYATKEVAQDGR